MTRNDRVKQIAGSATEAVSADTIEAKPVEWLWPAGSNLREDDDGFENGIIPRGMLTTIAGRPGEGKSMSTAFYAAYVSNLKGERSGVLFSNKEDPVHQVLRPRLEAAGANLANVHFFDFFIPKEDELILATIEMLEKMIYALNIGLIVADPIAAHIGCSLYNDQEVRRTLSPLAAMLARTGCAAICVAHVNKHTSKKAHPLSAIGGSGGGLVGASRSVFIFGKDPGDESIRVMAPAKFNLGPEPRGVAFDMESEEWRLGTGKNEKIIRTGKLGLLSLEHPVTAQAILSGSDGDGDSDGGEKKAIASEWLTGYLAAGPMAAATVRQDAADQGISFATLRRAADEVGVVKVRVYTQGTGKKGVDHVDWELPAGHPALASGEGIQTNIDGVVAQAEADAPTADDDTLASLEAALDAVDSSDDSDSAASEDV